MGDRTESSTRPFIRRHSVALSTTVNSFILNPLMVNIGSLTTLPRNGGNRSEEQTSELQSPCNIVWPLLLEKKKKIKIHQEKTKRTSNDGTSTRSHTMQ